MEDKPLSVLLIEDNPADANLVIELLKQSNIINFDVKWSTKLHDGLNKLKTQNFDIILLELSLPDSWGINTLFVTLEKTQNIPIIVLTGVDNDMLAINSVKKGNQDFLVKEQVDHIGLIRSIQYAIERKKLEDRLKETHQKLIESETKLLILRDRLEQKIIERSYGLGERIKQLSCLYDISKIVEQPNMTFKDVFQKVINRIPISMKYPEILEKCQEYIRSPK
ncbi:MAG: response regulator [Candidatus Lokiarchaeia archaeon]